ncbi:Hypothetical_protein [Hexamita inflata]|uniref:Hypothetical_protein n=1 Tax=Hexamita inflata TaxID=28002 RepID=A0AA86PRI2_9EUKA|nr:Hypothetical protein HINF_LOCUS27397 [Hexamita inflata]
MILPRKQHCIHSLTHLYFFSGKVTCPLQLHYSFLGHGIIPVSGSSMWWIAVIIVVFIVIAIVLSCWYTMTRRKRMLMMMNSQNRMVMGNGFVQQQTIQPAMPYTLSNQQPMYQQPGLLQQHSQYSYDNKVNNYPSNLPQNSIDMPAIM